MALNAWVWKQTMKHEGEPVLTLSLRRPEPPEDSRALRRMGRYYKRLGDAWKARWETVLYPKACAALAAAREESRPFQPWSAALDFTVALEDEGRLSLYTEAVERHGEARPVTVRTGDVWDLKSGTPLSLRDVLPPRARRSALLDQLTSQAEARLAGGESLLFQEAPRNIGRAFSARRFYLTAEGPVLFYPMLSLGSAGEGVPVFLLNAEELRPKKRPKKSIKILKKENYFLRHRGK